MQWFPSESELGMFIVEGEGFFTGVDIQIGEAFKETLLNEGLHVSVEYGVTEQKEQAMKIKFTTQSNTIFIG